MTNEKLEEINQEEVMMELEKLTLEIEAVSKSVEILIEAIKQRAVETGIENDVQEGIPDYIGEAGKKAKELVEKGKKKGIEWISREKTAPKVIQEIKEAPSKIDSKILKEQMVPAIDKIEKKKNRKAFSSKKEDLINVIKIKIEEWKDNGKESFATNLEVSKAYIGIEKGKIKAEKDKVVQVAKPIGTEAKVLSKMASGLEKDIEVAGKDHKTMQTRANQLLETPDIEKEEQVQSIDEEVR